MFASRLWHRNQTWFARALVLSHIHIAMRSNWMQNNWRKLYLPTFLSVLSRFRLFRFVSFFFFLFFSHAFIFSFHFIWFRFYQAMNSLRFIFIAFHRWPIGSFSYFFPSFCFLFLFEWLCQLIWHAQSNRMNGKWSWRRKDKKTRQRRQQRG